MNTRQTLSEEEFYGQDFEKEGVLSIWIGQEPAEPSGGDVLQECCGVGFYDVDFQEVDVSEAQVELSTLIRKLSYAESFWEAAEEAARSQGFGLAHWVLVQFDFAYDPTAVKTQIKPEPRFLGVFAYAKPDLG